jgi:hypothetical protein
MPSGIVFFFHEAACSVDQDAAIHATIFERVMVV